METIIRMVERSPSSTSQSGKPTIIKWHGCSMVRGHSINACVDEILQFNKRRQFLKINIIGMSGTGKTTLIHVLAHQIHTASDIPYEVKFFNAEQLSNFKATVQGLSNSNQILCFDDLSGLVEDYGKKALDRLKAEITTIRHINDQEDRKIIMMLSFHAQKMLDKQLRISNFAFYTDCQLEEVDYLIDLLGKQDKQKIEYFQKLKAQAGLTHKFTYRLGQRHSFTYKDGKPFQPMLYNNGLRTCHVVSPQLSWIIGDELCHICNPAIESASTKINLEQFVNDYSKKFTKGLAKRAVEIKLLELGMNTQPKRVQQAKKYIDRFLSRKQINIDELAEAYNLKEIKTLIPRVKQPEFLENENDRI